MNRPTRVFLRGALVALSAWSGLWATSASATPVRAVVDGLPAGLSTELVALRATCPTASSPGQIAAFFSMPMVETTFTDWVAVTLPDGSRTIRPRTRTNYSAQADLNLTTPCGATRFLGFKVRVLGERTATSLERRDATVGHERLPDGSISIRSTVQAWTDKMLKRDPVLVNVPFTQLARGVWHSIGAMHHNPFGAASVVAPVLEFLRPAPQPYPFGFATSTRLFITADGRNCIRANGTTKCHPGSPLQDGLLVHGGIALAAGVHLQGGSTTPASSRFNFRFNNDFPVGDYTLSFRADDADAIEYLVDGVPTPLDLIKWLPSTQPVQVIN